MSGTEHHIGPDSAPDRYRLLRSIGRGGEAVLYLAEIELAGGTEPVVVKVLDSKTTITPELFERVSRKWNEQAELLRFVHRPGVVGVREHFQGPPIHRPGEAGTLSGRALVLVMNHVDGLDLRDWRDERNLATPAERREVMRTLEQLADVLDWLHSGKATPSGRTVVHGDLSPGNVMVDQHGQATLVDFGLSKLTADHQTAEVWFTPGYAAPEVFEGKRTPGSDRYAFGAITYFLLSGQAPPPAPEQLAQAFLALPQIAALPAEQRARVASITSADPDRRPLSLSAWVKDVRHGVTSTTTASRLAASVQDAVPPPPPPAAPPTVGAAPAPQGAFGPAFPPPGATPVPAPAPSPASAPTPAQGPTPGPTPAPGPFPAPASTDTTAPTPAATPPQTPTQTPPARRRRRGPLVGAVAGVVLIAVLAVVGINLLGDKKKDEAAKSGDSTSPSAPATTDAATQPTPDPTTESPTDEPTDTGSADPDTSASPSYDPGSLPDVPVADLTTLSSVSEPDSFTVGPAKINTKEYGAALHGDCYNGAYVEYDLNREWQTFEFTAGIDDGSKIEAARVVVSVDDQPALFNETVELGKPISRTLKIAGALRLRLKVESSSCSDEGNGVIAGPTLRR
ncbi:protein kinase [Streptomyces sp. NPDC053493]|uniref:protein kinase domain-containing protein n=1 Tax=Streptomyces sp. NPDC053493 TaxID=3365705 RepID=UPI0037D428DE